MKKKIEKLEKVEKVEKVPAKKRVAQKRSRTKTRPRFGGIYARYNKHRDIIGYTVKYPTGPYYQFATKYVPRAIVVENKAIPVDAQKLGAVAKEMGLQDEVIVRCIRRLQL